MPKSPSHEDDRILSSLMTMQLGDTLQYGGRRYRLRGFDPMSVRPRRFYLEDADSSHPMVALCTELPARGPDARPAVGWRLEPLPPFE